MERTGEGEKTKIFAAGAAGEGWRAAGDGMAAGSAAAVLVVPLVHS